MAKERAIIWLKNCCLFKHLQTNEFNKSKTFQLYLVFISLKYKG